MLCTFSRRERLRADLNARRPTERAHRQPFRLSSPRDEVNDAVKFDMSLAAGKKCITRSRLFFLAVSKEAWQASKNNVVTEIPA